ncbi:MAG: carbohydrate binding family 9 domain-containing protein [Saprospiraceae bacterium]|nr:carbohydrate binding family 9 domain-containing protein [Saprospiraceae bacterium]MCF8249065.1 carbohydrate binding family 9 domain-containing protein [Saprospiraceae bacterium]MCF8280932.1 carbohydrate binding family 9 domain-containing protein [Bacteroidales bacterium]MCF8311087.1 carbohydrate binding family 9 domain-containing protein [Saprospiraceae bacterium]MCF8440177.1 carbohydrate binding family 9 domain-containing protein [Saprospiraceae bacterium]
MKLLFTTILLAFAVCVGQSQPPSFSKRAISATRISHGIKIDGKLDEVDWVTAATADGFIQNTPNPGKSATQNSEVWVLYDNTAMYIGARLLDASPDSILRQMTERDGIGNADWFAVLIDAYRDGNNGVGFGVTASGVQYDTKFSASNSGGGFSGVLSSGDESWDAVWDSEIDFTSDGWTVELKIPYSAIRFPSVENQIWNVNFVREVRRSREISFWNEVDPNVSGYLNQSGTLDGISNVKSPVRLSATPYFSMYAENYYDKNSAPKSSWGRSINGGMDIKYGINDAFTLDATLVPDFGQVRSDNQVLNLSPFEVRFDENRQFFTEGTELFNKGGLFYSRRVGGRPLHFFDVDGQLGENETMLDNPAESQLINATKVSGRTNSGLGIGVFNAISSETHATLKNEVSGDKRTVLTSPLTNYNIVVLDQNLPHNSYVSLINTNVLRRGDDYEANITGTRFLLRNKAQSYAFNGKAVVNQKYFPNSATDFGHSYFGEISKTSGQVQWELGYNVESYDYDPNDLGFIFSPNEKSLQGAWSFNKNEPFGNFINGSLTIDAEYTRLDKPNVFAGFGTGLDGFLVTKNRVGFGMFVWLQPVETFDYFEPRADDFSRYYLLPSNRNIGGFISTDYRKKLALDMRVNYRKFDEEGRYRLNLTVSPRFRASDRLSFYLEVGNYNWKNDVGYVTTLDNGQIILGRRDNITVENVLNTTYVFTNKMSLSFRLRHYWAKAEYNNLYLLLENGALANTSYNEFSDDSFNAFTVDAVYRWRFAPGSDIFLVWKNNTENFSEGKNDIQYSYRSSLDRLTEFPQRNSFSVRVIYFLDYLDLKRN